MDLPVTQEQVGTENNFEYGSGPARVLHDRSLTLTCSYPHLQTLQQANEDVFLKSCLKVSAEP